MWIRASVFLCVGLVVAVSANTNYQNGPPSFKPENEGYWVFIPGTTPSPYEEIPKPEKNSYYPIQFSMSGTNRPTSRDEGFGEGPQAPNGWSRSEDSGPQAPRAWSRSEDSGPQAPREWSRSENSASNQNSDSQQPPRGWQSSQDSGPQQPPRDWPSNDQQQNPQAPEGWTANRPQRPQQRSMDQVPPGSDFDNEWTQARIPLSRAEPTDDQKPESWGVGNGRLPNDQQTLNQQNPDQSQGPRQQSNQFEWSDENQQSRPTFDQNPNQQSRPTFDQNPNQQSRPTFDQNPNQQSRPTFDQNPNQQSRPTFDQNPNQQSRPTFDQNPNESHGSWNQQSRPNNQQTFDQQSSGQNQRFPSQSNPQSHWSRADNDEQPELTPTNSGRFRSGASSSGPSSSRSSQQNTDQGQAPSKSSDDHAEKDQTHFRPTHEVPLPSTQGQDTVVQEVPDWNKVENKPVQSDKTEQPETPSVEHGNIRAEPRKNRDSHDDLPVGKYTEPLYEDSPKPKSKPRPVWP